MKRAFTLIELLVVIAIIAILAAILFPVFAQAKAAAKKTADLNDQKQLNLGAIMYLGDNDDTYPMTVPGNNGGSLFTMPVDRLPTNNPGIRQSFFGNSVQPYIKNYAMYSGPGGTTDFNPFGAQTPTPIVSTQFAENSYLNAWNSSASPAPAHTVLVWNPMGNWRVPGYGFSYPLIFLAGGILSTGGPTFQFQNTGAGCVANIGFFTGTEGVAGSIKHNQWGNGDNVSYADGHAKFAKFGSGDFPYLLNTDGTLSGWWVDTIDSQAGCNYAWTLRPDMPN